MLRISDYFYAAVPSAVVAVPIAQVMPDLGWMAGVEKLGIVGILAGCLAMFILERRSFISKSGQRLEAVEKRLSTLETNVSSGNDKVVHLLTEQLSALREIKDGQIENFRRMWDTVNKPTNK
ncbi:MAG: hypothetical protein ACRC2T_00310 [Thermoguttaceae bacterium]